MSSLSSFEKNIILKKSIEETWKKDFDLPPLPTADGDDSWIFCISSSDTEIIPAPNLPKNRFVASLKITGVKYNGFGLQPPFYISSKFERGKRVLWVSYVFERVDNDSVAHETGHAGLFDNDIRFIAEISTHFAYNTLKIQIPPCIDGEFYFNDGSRTKACQNY